MRRWQKGVLWGIVGLAALLAIGAFSLHTLADGDRLRQLAHDKVEQTWARELTVGEMAVDLFPYPRLRATNIAVSNPEWAQDKNFVEASRLTAGFALLPLLTGKVVLKSLYFDGLKANLEVAKDGRRNWDMPHGGQRSPEQIALTDLKVKNGILVVRGMSDAPVVLQVEELRADADSHLHNIVFDARVRRNAQLLQLDGRMDDLSAFGTPDAMTAGTLNARIGSASASVTGKFPIDPALQRYALAASIDAQSMQQAYAFFGSNRRSPVPLKASAVLQGYGSKTDVSDLKLQMGRLNLSGTGHLDRGGARPVFDATLQADRVDMTQTFIDAGRPPLPPKAPGELFRDVPLAWPMLVKLDGMDGRITATIASLRLRSGIEVTEAAAQLNVKNDVMTVPSFSGKLLNGTASGDAVFEGNKKAVDLNLKLNNTLLSRWFSETGKKVALTDGRMQVDARIHANGASMKDLAATVTGPINIRIGGTQVLSQKAGQAEFWLTGLFSAKNSDRLDLSCLSARLPFQSGVARGEGIVGVRSDASQLLTGGTVDMRSQTLDLRGRVRARSGISLGWSTFGGNVKIVGKLAKPEWRVDESGVAAIARIGAAIVTGGISIVATSIWDGANPESDPCQVVFSPRDKATKNAPAHQPADHAMP